MITFSFGHQSSKAAFVNQTQSKRGYKCLGVIFVHPNDPTDPTNYKDELFVRKGRFFGTLFHLTVQSLPTQITLLHVDEMCIYT